MDSSNSNITSYLDKMRLENGTDEYRKYFRNLVMHNMRKSLQLLNDENLSFSSLFTLRSEVRRFSLTPYLSSRNRNALKIVNAILNRNSDPNTRSTPIYKEMGYSDVRWIFETGYKDDGISNEYDEVLDMSAILLTRLHKDKTFLKHILEMIFKRHKRGLYINDLVWAFFEARDPQCLVMLANRMNSSDRDEAELAYRLLSFIPGIHAGAGIDNTKVLNWIHDNYMFLYYTGESFQQGVSPIPYAISREGKYLFKAVNPDSGKLVAPLAANEENLLSNFRTLDEKGKLLLSEYSFLLHRQNVYQWNTWLLYPVAEQLRIAETMIGGLP